MIRTSHVVTGAVAAAGLGLAWAFFEQEEARQIDPEPVAVAVQEQPEKTAEDTAAAPESTPEAILAVQDWAVVASDLRRNQAAIAEKVDRVERMVLLICRQVVDPRYCQ